MLPRVDPLLDHSHDATMVAPMSEQSNAPEGDKVGRSTNDQSATDRWRGNALGNPVSAGDENSESTTWLWPRGFAARS